MIEHLKRPGWIYVLHDNYNTGLATEIKLGLNRLGYPIWVRERDAPDQTDLKAHNIGVERAIAAGGKSDYLSPPAPPRRRAS